MIFCFKGIKVNDIDNSFNKFLLAADKFLSEMHLKQLGFTYSACDHLLKTKKELKTLRKRKIQTIFTKMNLISFFQHYIAYGDFKYLAKITASDDVLRDQAFNAAKNLKYNGYQRGLLLLFTIFLIKSDRLWY